MATKVNIHDPHSQVKTRVTNDGALWVTMIPTSINVIDGIYGDKNPYQFLKGDLGTTGLDSGSTAMNVNGTTGDIEFHIGSNPEYDIYITNLIFLIVDNTVSHNTFGSLSEASVTNGWNLYLNEEGNITYFIKNARSVGQIAVQTGMINSFYAGSQINELTAFSGNLDAAVIPYPISSIIPNGIRLARGSTNRIVSVIRDNFSSLDDFRVTAFGYKIYPL